MKKQIKFILTDTTGEIYSNSKQEKCISALRKIQTKPPVDALKGHYSIVKDDGKSLEDITEVIINELSN